MDSIRIDVAGARQVGLRFDEFPDRLYDDLRVTIDDLSRQLFGLIRAKTPDLSGRLLGQERLRLFADKNRITGYVDIAGEGSQDFAKAAALEYGSKGKSTGVKAHGMRLDHYWATQLARPRMVMVEAYNRTPNIAEAAFERGPLATMAPEIAVRLNAVVENATKVAST
jgi:hypothetical protein